MNRNKFFSILLVITLAFQAFPLSVFAQTDETTTVTVTADTQNQTVEAGNVTVENGDGVVVTAENGNTAEVTTGDVQASETGVQAKSDGAESTITATTGEITAGENGVYATSTNGGSIAIDTEDITSGQTGVTAFSQGENSSITVTAGEINSESTAISASNLDEGAVEIQAESAKSESGAGVAAGSYGEGSSITVNISGEVSSIDGTGVSAYSTGGGAVTEVQAGSVQSQNGTGINAWSFGGETTVEISGEVNSELTGIFVDSEDGATVEVHTDSVHSESGTGVKVNNSGECSYTNIDVFGDVTANGESVVTTNTNSDGNTYQNVSRSDGVSINNQGSSYYDSSKGERVYTDAGTVDFSAGSVTSEDRGIFISNSQKGTVDVDIAGDVTANGEAVVMSNTYSDGSSYQSVNRSDGVAINNRVSSYYDSSIGEYVHMDAGTVDFSAGTVTSEDRGIYISNNQNGTINVDIAGNVTSNGENIITKNTNSDGSTYSNIYKSFGTNINNSSGGIVNINAENLISAGDGIYVNNQSELNPSSINLEIGDVTANGKTIITTNIDTNGEVTHNVSPAIGVAISNNSNSSYDKDSQEWVQNDAGTVTANTGNIYSEHYGLGIKNYNNGTVIITTGNITENGKPFAFEGNSITGQTPYNREYLPDKQTFLNVYRPVGFFINNYNGGYIDLSTGFIESMSNGIFIYNTDEDSTILAKTEDITAKGETISHKFSSGAYVTNLNGAETDLITGSITSTGIGIHFNNSGKGSSISAEMGDITANGERIVTENTYSNENTNLSLNDSSGIEINNNSGGTVDVVTGEIKSTQAGIYVYNTGKDSSVTIDTSDVSSKGNRAFIPQIATYFDANGNSHSYIYSYLSYPSDGAFVSNYEGNVDLQTGEINSEIRGIRIQNYDNGSVKAETGDINVTGNWTFMPVSSIYSDTNGNYYIQDYISSYPSDGVLIDDNGGKVELSTGNISTETFGIRLLNYKNGTISVDTGDITTNGETITIPLTRTYYDADGKQHTVTSISTYTSDGITVRSTDNGKTNLTTGNISATGSGIHIESIGKDVNTNLSINGNISAGSNGLQTNNLQGILEISILGNVSSIGYGIVSSTNTTGTTNITVEGDVSSQNSTGAIISAYNEGTTNISVGGDITSGNNLGVSVSDSGKSEADLSVGGNVLSAGEGIGANGIRISAYDNSQANVSVEGDVRTSSEEGIGLSVYSRDNSMVDVLVAGTIAGDQVGVSLGETGSDEEGNRYSDPTTAENFKLTVWQIELNEEDHAVESTNNRLADLGEVGTVIKERETVYGEIEQEFEQSILYIIKVEQPVEGATLQATDANGKPLEKSHDYEVAHEGETVLMKVNIQSGFELLGAYNGLGEKVPLLRDKTGNFYIEVPKGGGVYLSAQLGRIPAASTPEHQENHENTNKKPAQTTYNAAYSIPNTGGTDEFTITYVLNSGHFEDPQQTLSFKALPGEKHVMLNAPSRDGYRFRHWVGAPYTKSDPRWVEPDLNSSYPYVPGSWFTLGRTDWTFIAVWDEIR